MPNNKKNTTTFISSENLIKEDGLFNTLKRGSKKFFKKKDEVPESQSSYKHVELKGPYFISNSPTTRQGENEVRNRGARDRRALTGEAGNASRRQVIVGDVSMNSVRDECTSDAGRSRLNIGHVMQTNFGDTTAEIFREHSDSLVKNSKKDNLEGNSTTNTLQNINGSSYPDYMNISSTHSLNILNSSSNDQSKANNKKKGVFEVTKVTDVKSATTRPLPAIPLSDEEILNKIILSNFGDAIKKTITNPYELDDFQDELTYKVFKTLVHHFDPDKNDEKILKKLFKDFKNFLENPYMSMNGNMNIPIQNNASDLSGCQNFNGFFSQKDSIKATDENQSEQTLKL